MTKINHRLNTAPRRTAASYEAAPLRELAYLDAVTHMALGRSAPAYRYGKQTTLRQFVYEQAPVKRQRNGGQG